MLEKENAMLREDMAVCSQAMHAVIEKLPFAAAAVDEAGHIICGSPAFFSLAGFDNGDESILGSEPRDYIPPNILNLILNGAAGNTETINKLADYDGRKVSVSVLSVRRGGMSVCFIRDIRDISVAGEEIVIRIKESINRQMAMVQKIGFLLGEEVSEVSKNLDSVIKIIDTAKDAE